MNIQNRRIFNFALLFFAVFFWLGISCAKERPDSFAELAEKSSSAVVNISVEKVTQMGGQGRMPFNSPFGENDPFRDFFDRFFGDRMPRKFKQRGLGSGFVIDRDGYILTNNHVVEGADKIEVTLSDDKSYEAEIVGRDPKTDLALIKVDEKLNAVPLKLGNSDEIRVGDWVVAIGSPFGLGHTVTAGIVSAKYRRIGMGAYDDFIQTDASINPGNSGGPLLNTDGKVIGINSAIFSQSGGNVGIGFAIPINMVKDLLPQLKKGKVVRGWLGVVIQDITPELKETFDLKNERGALVSDISEDSPAEEAGIERGDVIVSFDGNEIKEMDDLPYLVALTPAGKEVEVKVIRDGKEKKLDVVIEELKEENVTMQQQEREKGPRLGMSLMENSREYAQRYNLPVEKGIVVTQVMPGSTAALAGIQPGDILLELDRKPIKSMSDFKERLSSYKKGDTLLFLVRRQTGSVFLTLRIDE